MNDWSKFGLAVGLCCLLFPPMLGFVLGVGIFVGIWYLIFQLLGGNS